MRQVRSQTILPLFILCISCVSSRPATVTDSPSELLPEERLNAPSTQSTDGILQRKVEDAMLFDAFIGPEKPQVTVRNSVVTLDGSVGSLEAKEFAERNARTTPGVKSVINRLRVQRNYGLLDSRLKEEVSLNLALNSRLVGQHVDVYVNEGVVTLKGEVGSDREKRLAETIAAGSRGTNVVLNQLKVRKTRS